MAKRLPVLLSLCAALLALAPAVTAAPKAEVAPAKDGARLLVGGKLVTIFRTPNAGLSPERRAQLAADRLTELVQGGLGPQDIEVRRRGSNWGVYAAGGLVMIATPEEASERSEEPEATARRWAANLKTALKRPAPEKHAGRARKPGAGAKAEKAEQKRPAEAPEGALTVEEKSLAVPVGETRVVTLGGKAQGQITVKSEDQETAGVEVVEGKAAVSVAGMAPGKATIHVSRGGKDVFFTAWVKKYAGKIGPASTVEVTGESAPAALIRQVARQRVTESLQVEPGANVEFTGAPEGLKPISPGESEELSFPVTLSGDAYLPVRSTVKVKVANVSLPPAAPKLLLYSNDPESVKEYGTLYQGPVDADGPVRLLYHHENKMRRPMTFQIHLLNPSDSPVDAQVVGGEAGPYVDPIQVGHRAATRYMAALTKDVGYIAHIPARGSAVIHRVEVPYGNTVSGLFNFRVLNNGAALVAHVSAAPEATTPAVSPGVLEVARNEPHVYTTPQKQETYHYTIGKPWAFVPIGRKAITARTKQKQLFGNYGVLYEITVDVDNPTDEMRTVSVVLAPEAGWARGIFMIDGKLVEAPQVAPPAEAVLWSMKLAPGEQRKVSIQGIPVGGSSYPVSIVVRS